MAKKKISKNEIIPLAGYIPSNQTITISKEQQPPKVIYHERGIIKAAGVENGTTTLYVVPEGKVFLLQGFTLQNECVTVGGGQCRMKANGIQFVANLAVINTNAILNISLPSPVIHSAGTIFTLISEVGGTIAFGIIYGTESDNISLFQGN